MSKIGNYYVGLQETYMGNDSEEPYRGSTRFCTDREILKCKGNFAFRIFIRKMMSDISSYVDTEIHPLLLEREYIEWEISRSKQDLIEINRRIEDEM
jgi:hypothetical protein